MDCSENCAKVLRCRGLQWWRWRQLHWKEVERDKWAGPHPKRFKVYIWENMVSAEVSKVCGNADGFAESVQLSTGWLHFAQDRGQWLQFAKLGKKPNIDAVVVKTQWSYTSRYVELVERILWRHRVASNGGGGSWRRVVDTSGTK